MNAPGVDVHLRCVVCGYDLYLIDPAGACPECGQPIARSQQLWCLLYVPASARIARKMARSTLISSVFAGLCPAAAYYVGGPDLMGGDGILQRGCLVILIFAVCCTYATTAARHRRSLLGQPRVASLASLAELIATCGLALIAAGATCFAIGLSREEWDAYTKDVLDVIAATNVGVGFFLVGVVACRAVPEWMAQARVARMMGFGKLRWAMILTAWIKTIYETLWLGSCWIPIAGNYFEITWVDRYDFYLFRCAELGVACFGIVWALMVVVHTWQLLQIRRHTRAALIPPIAPGSDGPVGLNGKVAKAASELRGCEAGTVLR